MRISMLFLVGLTFACNFSARATDENRDWESAQRIRDTATRFVEKQSASTARVEASPLDSRLRLPACPRPLAASAANAGTQGSWSVSVSCSAGANSTPLWSIYVPVKVVDLRPVVVLNRPLAPGQVITADAVKLEPRDIAGLSLGYLDDIKLAIGQVLRRPLSQGATLTPDTVGPQKLISRGALVTIIGRSGTLEVRAQGKALGDGGSGERISVENISSHRVVDAIVRDGGSVEVGL
jgi:flagellar basal body P-ring formation protein FlgA